MVSCWRFVGDDLASPSLRLLSHGNVVHTAVEYANWRFGIQSRSDQESGVGAEQDLKAMDVGRIALLGRTDGELGQ